MSDNTTALWFIFHDKKLLLVPEKKGIAALPHIHDKSRPDKRAVRVHELGYFENWPCFACVLEKIPDDLSSCIPVDLRASYEILDEALYLVAGRGSMLAHWNRFSQFCPACGAETVPALPISKKCPSCGHEIFPHIAVATIVLVRKQDSILLIRAHSLRGSGHGLVAGFLEPGETLEECVAREVLEETGLFIGNIRYFASQPWPYPSGLMVGFTADYVSGDIQIQAEELSSAAFYPREGLPSLPAKLSIARRLVDDWLNAQ